MRRVRLALGLSAAMATVLLPGIAAAQTEGRFGGDASVTVGYQNNPFTEIGPDTGTGEVTLDLAPYYQLRTERSTITAAADADLQQYFSKFGRNDSYSASVDYAGRPTQRITTHARAEVSSAVLGAVGNYFPVPGVTGVPGAANLPGVDATGLTSTDATGVTGATGVATTLPTTALTAPSITPITDVGLFGLRNRRKTARLTGDAGIGLTARDSLTLSAYGEVTRYDDLVAGDYQAYGGSVGYSRRVSDSINFGVQGSAYADDYRRGLGSTRVYSVQGTASGRLNARWTVNGALGVSFVDSDATAVSTRSTSLSGNINLCRAGPLTSLCAQAARQVSPTGFAGSQYVTTAGLNWSRRLGERDSVTAGASYSDVGGDTRLVTGVAPFQAFPLQTQYVQAQAGYSRQLRQRLRFVASVDYRQLLGSGDAGRPKDFGGQAGLSYHFGN